ncbi:MAG: ImmA/IrrE family metallo-endopeptidase [Planctomycetota bacterium]
MKTELGVGERVERLVEELLEDAGIEGPPVDAVCLARRLGLELRLDKSQQARGRLVQGRFQPTICVKPEPREERTQWTVAHEIGEHVLARLSFLRELEEARPGGRAREELANHFASLLLVPTSWLERDCLETDWDLWALKERYQTASYEVLATRMLDLEPHAILTIFDQGKLIRRRGNLPFWPPKLQPVEAQAQKRAHVTGRPELLHADNLTVQAWPIHETGWKREILRSVVCLDDAQC